MSTKTFLYESPTFTTLKDCEKYKKECIKNICEFFGLDRAQFRLQQNTILLRGNTPDNETFLNLTRTIGQYKEFISNDKFKEYKLYCELVVK